MLLKKSINVTNETFHIKNVSIKNRLKYFTKPPIKISKIPTEMDIEQYAPSEETRSKIFCHQIIRIKSLENLKSHNLKVKLQKYFQIDENQKRKLNVERFLNSKKNENAYCLIPDFRKLIAAKKKENLITDKFRSLSETVKENYKTNIDETRIFSNDFIQSRLVNLKKLNQKYKYYEQNPFLKLNARNENLDSEKDSKENIFPVITVKAIKPTIETNIFHNINSNYLNSLSNRNEYFSKRLKISKFKKSKINFLNRCLKIPCYNS